MKTHFFSILFFIGICCAGAKAQTQQQQLDRLFTAFAENRHFSGNVLVAERGKVLYEKSFGYADPVAKRLNTAATQFPVASTTKPFTATAILQLQEKGKLNINDKVIQYLPDFPYKDITIKNLLSQTSGLATFEDFFDPVVKVHPDTVFTNSQLIEGISDASKPLLFTPGGRWQYNNANYAVLAVIVARVSGLAFADYIQHYILAPAGMNQSFISASSLFHYTEREKENLAIPYFIPHLYYSRSAIRTDTIPFLSRYYYNYNFKGFGDLITTTSDLLKFDQALYTGKLISPVSLQEAYTPVFLNDGTVNPARYGYGWQITKDSTIGTVVNHPGGMAGVYTSLARNISKNQTVIVCSIGQDFAVYISNTALRILSGQPVGPPKKSAAELYGTLLLEYGPAKALAALDRARRDTLHYSVDEGEFNELGYDLMRDDMPYQLPLVKHYKEALVVLRLNTTLFPNSWNVYDSYGEALAKTGSKKEALEMYQKSLSLNPDNTNAKQQIARLEAP